MRFLAIGLLVVGWALAFPVVGNAKELPGLVVYFTFDEGKGNVMPSSADAVLFLSDCICIRSMIDDTGLPTCSCGCFSQIPRAS